jgi:GDPmannose 4,6-dehydratase
LLGKGYDVHGLIRRSSTFNTSRLDHLYVDPHESGANLHLHYGDLGNSEQIANLVYNLQPQEIYHLGAQSHVKVSFDMPEYTGDVTALGTTRILEAIRRSGVRCRFYQASSSEMFGSSPPPQNEATPLHPQSPYAAAKTYAYWMSRAYVTGYGMHVSNGILFNHESPRRGETFVSRKITRAVAAIKAKKQQKLYLGNLEAQRDWGFAPEYVEAMWAMLQQERCDDYVIGTGESHTVKQFVQEAFAYAGLDWEAFVEVDPRYFRPAEVHHLRADASKAKRQLGWSPKVSFKTLVRIMLDADLEALGVPCPGDGKRFIHDHLLHWEQWSKPVRR